MSAAACELSEDPFTGVLGAARGSGRDPIGARCAQDDTRRLHELWRQLAGAIEDQRSACEAAELLGALDESSHRREPALALRDLLAAQLPVVALRRWQQTGSAGAQIHELQSMLAGAPLCGESFGLWTGRAFELIDYRDHRSFTARGLPDGVSGSEDLFAFADRAILRAFAQLRASISSAPATYLLMLQGPGATIRPPDKLGLSICEYRTLVRYVGELRRAPRLWLRLRSRASWRRIWADTLTAHQTLAAPGALLTPEIHRERFFEALLREAGRSPALRRRHYRRSPVWRALDTGKR